MSLYPKLSTLLVPVTLHWCCWFGLNHDAVVPIKATLLNFIYENFICLLKCLSHTFLFALLFGRFHQIKTRTCSKLRVCVSLPPRFGVLFCMRWVTTGGEWDVSFSVWWFCQQTDMWRFRWAALLSQSWAIICRSLPLARLPYRFGRDCLLRNFSFIENVG